MITLAKDGMRTELERIWRACFNDPPEYIKYFFDNRYDPNTCAVFIDDATGRPVAMLHMLDASITEDSEIIPVQYIYAAATRPDHQRRGIMRQLIEFARRCAYAKRQRYMILAPGTRELYRFYEKNGFYKCFKVRNIFMTRNDLMILSRCKKAADPSRPRAVSLSISDVFAIRRDVLIDRDGYISWDYPSVKYAAGVHARIGGTIITDTNGSDAGYAFCLARDDRTVDVSEFIAHSGFAQNVVRRILESYPQQYFELRVPVYDEFFAPFGEINDLGMIRSVTDKKPINILTLSGTHLPYLGLPLD